MFSHLSVDSPYEGSLSLKATYTQLLTHTPRCAGGHMETPPPHPPGFQAAANHSPPEVTLGNRAPRGKAGDLGGKSEKFSTEELSQKERQRCFIALIHLESPLLHSVVFPISCFSVGSEEDAGLAAAKVVFHRCLR